MYTGFQSRSLSSIVVGLVSLSAIASLVFFVSCSSSNYPKAIKGCMDLTSFRFEQNTSVRLDGEWLFTQGSFTESDAAIKCYVPGSWSKDANSGPYGFGMYSLTMVIPPNSPPLALYMTDQAIAWDMDINGIRVAKSGTPGKTAVETIVQRQSPIIIPIHSQQASNTVCIAIRISNFHYNIGGLINPIFLGTETSLRLRRDNSFIATGILFGALVLFGIYHAVVFTFRRDDKATLYFCICCFLFAFRLLTVSHYPEQIFPALFTLSSKIEYLCFYIALPVYIAFVCNLFPLGTEKLWLRFYWTTGVLASILVLILPVQLFMAWTTFPYQLVTVSAGCYVLYIFYSACIDRKQGAIIAMVGFILLFILVINDILHANLIIHTAHLTPLGIVIFIVSHSFVIAIRFSDTYKREKALVQELNMQKEILDIKIAEQTSELHDVIQKLEESDKAKSRMLAMLSHELRTPITLIIAPVEQAIKGIYGEIINNNSEFFQGLKRNAYRLLHVVEGLFDYAKIELGKYNLNQQILELGETLKFYTSEAESMTTKKCISLHFHSSVDHPIAIKVDKYLFETAFFNLVFNAVKYTATGGCIDIFLSLATSSSEQDSNTYAEIRVKDSGIGIEPDLIPSIFDKLYHSDNGNYSFSDGAGIGLSLTKKIVELHGGSIRVESCLGKGSCFIITLPILKENFHAQSIREQTTLYLKTSLFLCEAEKNDYILEDENNEDTTPSIVNTSINEKINDASIKPTVLIVEDNSELRTFLKTELSSEFHVIEAMNGKQAFAVLNSNAGINIVVSDIMMPKMDGLALLKKCQTLPKRVNMPFLFLTAKSETETRIKALREGACDYIEKPFNMEELISRMQNLLESHACIKKEALEELRGSLLNFLELAPTQASKIAVQNTKQKIRMLDLTFRETLIVQGVMDGLTDKEIAFNLKCASKTVSNTLTRLYRKYNVTGRAELIRFMLT